MTRNEFRQLNKNGKVHVKSHFMGNSLPSSTDPTQDIPVVSMVNSILTGKPIHVRENPMAFGAIPTTADMTAIDKRNNDTFDVYAEMKRTGKKISKVTKFAPIKENED